MKKLTFIIVSFATLLASCSSEPNKNQKDSAIKSESTLQIPYPVAFKINSADVYTGKQFDKFKTTYLKELKDKENYLIIEGHYFKNEKNNTRARNLGISRAEELKKLMSQFVDENRITIESRFLEMEFNSDWESSHSIQVKSGKIEDLKIKESTEMLTLYFPANTSEVMNDAFSKKLKSVAIEMKNSKLGANIICHTGGTNDSKKDYELGKKIADEIKAYLVSNGVNGDEIRSSSMGSSQPMKGESDRRIQVIFSSN